MPPRLAISRKSFALQPRTSSHPSIRISALFVRRFVLTAAFSRSPLSHPCLAAPAAGGMRVLTEYASTRPNPFLVGISGVLKKPNPLRLPPGTPSHTTWTGMGCCAYPMRGVCADRGSPMPPCPAGRRNGWTALMNAVRNGHHEIVEKLVVARADVNTKHRNGCALPRGPSGGICWSPTLPIAPCAVRQVDSAALCGDRKPHQMRRGAARRRRRPDHHER
jgi:hypothetical protein